VLTDTGYGDRTPRPGRRRGIRRIYSLDGLRTRVWMTGPKWRRFFDVHQRPLGEVYQDRAAFLNPRKHVLVFTLEDDIRELVLEELRPGVYAQWSDPRERFR